jgi:hypothetical protein
MQDVLITVFILGYKTTYNSMLSGNLSSIYILFHSNSTLQGAKGEISTQEKGTDRTMEKIAQIVA